MKVKVVVSFRDVENFALVHKVGDVLNVPEERAQKLIGLKLVTAVEDIQKPEEPTEAEKPVEEAKKVEPKKRRGRK